jgi:hypothetical protein
MATREDFEAILSNPDLVMGMLSPKNNSEDDELMRLLASQGLVIDPSKLPKDAKTTLGRSGADIDLYSNPNQVLGMLQQPTDTDQLNGTTSVASTPSILEAIGEKPKHAGAERVNENTTNTGIRAIVGQDGKVTLTNLDAENKAIKKGAISYDSNGTGTFAQTESQKGLATNAHGILKQMQSTSDINALRGMQAQFTEVLAKEKTDHYTKAFDHASKQLQIPVLQAALEDAMRLDREAPDWRPGLGDSPNTTKIRTTIEDARTRADAIAKQYLATNVGYNSLVAAEKTAESEVQRLTRLADKKDTIEFQKELQADNRRALRQEELEEKAKGLTLEQKNRLRTLHPEFATSPDTELVAVIGKHKSKDGYVEAIDAPDSELPKLAATGNKHAEAIVVAKERNAGIDDAITRDRIKRLSAFANDDSSIKRAIKLSGVKGDKEIGEAFASVKALSAPGASAESKKQSAAIRLDYARSLLADEEYQKFLGNVSSWQTADPSLRIAMDKAKNAVGKADVKSVLVEYLGETTGQQRIQAMNNFISIARDAAAQTEKSTLAAIDKNKLTMQIQTIETKSLLQRLLSDEYVHPVPSMNRNKPTE